VKLEKILLEYFGYPSFRSNQKDIIQSVVDKNDTLVIMPTGGGKSLCYQIPGLFFPHTTIVISPLISLMQDQVQALEKRNIPATYINSSLSKIELNNRLKNLDQYKFIYLAPERLQTNSWQEASKNLKISLIAIDEAHCISEWGHDFRPPYLQISQYIQSLTEKPPILALTATATVKTKNEIISSLNLTGANIFLGSFTRTNLNLIIKHFPTIFEKELNLFKLLFKHQGQSGIIYTQTRKQAEYIAKLVNFYFPDNNCQSYHGGLSSEQRKNIQNDFIENKVNLITATNAFGMGVDKANIRFVIHFGTPGSIENYYQEVGRAGRDSKISWCYLLHHPHDLEINKQLISKSQLLESSNKKQQIVKKEKLNAIISLITKQTCLTKQLENYFGNNPETINNNCSCSVCKSTPISFTSIQIINIQKLLQQRKILAKKHKLNIQQIMTDQIIAWIALLSPQSKIDFLKIPGIGRGWVERWSDDIIPYI
jgi:ATP-dependent DNA helicase RecQ